MRLTTRRVLLAALLAGLGAAFGPDIVIRLEPVLRAIFGGAI